MKIERRLQEWSDFAVAGVPADVIFADPDYDVYRRAFRLKRFYRCPCCDEKSIETMDDIIRVGIYIRCLGCQWYVYVWRMIDRDSDDLLLEIVRGVPVQVEQRPVDRAFR